MKTVLLIDGHSLLHRAFHAMPGFTSPDGTPTGALYGFTKMIFGALVDFNYDCTIVAWDTSKPTFRHQMYVEYKQHRPETDESLRDQIPLAQEMVGLLGLEQYSFEGYEADDIIGTIADQMAARNEKLPHDIWQTKILSSDHDLLQLVQDNVSVLITQKGISQLKEYKEAQVKEKYELLPYQIIELKGLMGDSSDNIPGVKGVGIKTATKLLKDYDTVEGVYQHLGEITGRTNELLATQHEEAMMSKELATIRTDAPVTVDIEVCAQNTIQYSQLLNFIKRYGFNSLISQYNALVKKFPEDTSTQEGLFDAEVDTKDQVANEVSDENLNINESLEALLQWSVSGEYVYFQADVLDGSVHVALSDGEEVFLVDQADLMKQSNVERLQKFLNGHQICGYDLKSSLTHVYPFSLTFEPYFDTMIADVICNRGKSSKTPQEALFQRLGIIVETDSATNKTIFANTTFLQKKMHESLNALLQDDQKSLEIFTDIEMPLIPILFKMERQGIILDTKKLKLLEEELFRKLKDLESEIFSDIGHEINLNSPKQLEEVLFDELNLPVIKRTKTQRSTNEQVLMQLRHLHPMIDKLLEYRRISKIQSTYTNNLLDYADDQNRVHTQYNQLRVVTARLSSVQPNLQNIPREAEYSVREVFIAPDDYQLLALDYSQIELRILSHLSQDKSLQESFVKGQDIHTVTAARIFDVFVDDVTDRQRQIGKTINFAVMYGMGPHALSESLEIEYVEAK
ncbi:DNA polymerase I, partial [candidate division WWE3 bacterium]|nr:DNA polymerase I [candidate division WWE3 bacterium]